MLIILNNIWFYINALNVIKNLTIRDHMKDILIEKNPCKIISTKKITKNTNSKSRKKCPSKKEVTLKN